MNKKHKGITLCHLGKIKKGLEVLKKEVRTRQKSPEYWNHVSLCYFLDKNIPKAEFYINIALQKSKHKDPASLNNLGVIRLHQNNPEEAMLLFQKSHKLKRRMISPQFNLSQIYLSYNHHKKALDLLKNLLRKSPKDTDILMGIASAYLMQGKINKSLSYLNQIPSHSKQREDVLFIRILTLFQNKKYRQARDLLFIGPKSKYKNIRASKYLLKKIINDKIDDLENKKKTTQGKA